MQKKPKKDCGWVGHVCGAKEVIQAMQQEQHAIGSDTSVILGWSVYFDVLARFSFRHWRTESIKTTALQLGFTSDGSALCALQYLIARASFAREIPTILNHAHPIVPLLAEVFDTILDSSNPQYHTPEYQQSLDSLSLRLANTSVVSKHEEEPNGPSDLLELTRLAALIYFERVSRNFSGHSTKIGLWIANAQAILVNLHECPCPFTLLIFGCEASLDEDRLILLDLFTRLEQRPHLISLLEVKGLIQSAWIQHDLEVERSLEYIRKLNLVVSSRDAVPSFM